VRLILLSLFLSLSGCGGGTLGDAVRESIPTVSYDAEGRAAAAVDLPLCGAQAVVGTMVAGVPSGVRLGAGCAARVSLQWALIDGVPICPRGVSRATVAPGVKAPAAPPPDDSPPGPTIPHGAPTVAPPPGGSSGNMPAGGRALNNTAPGPGA